MTTWSTIVRLGRRNAGLVELYLRLGSKNVTLIPGDPNPAIAIADDTPGKPLLVISPAVIPGLVEVLRIVIDGLEKACPPPE